MSLASHIVDNSSPRTVAYSVDGFCRASGISRTTLYELWASGRGPRFVKIGAKKLITADAAQDWARGLEAGA